MLWVLWKVGSWRGLPGVRQDLEADGLGDGALNRSWRWKRFVFLLSCYLVEEVHLIIAKER